MTHIIEPFIPLDRPVRKAVVIGSGSMGAGIAALIASSGAQVTLLDVASKGDNRNARAAAGRDLQIKRKGFTHPHFAENVTVGNTEDDLAAVAKADWVVEAIFENVEAKLALYDSLAPHLGEQTVVSSNTSTIPLATLTSRMSEAHKRNFFITHFFNPPRIMKLVELITGPDSDPAQAEWLREILDVQLGKRTLVCKDTPGFIANRIGNLWMAAGAIIALEQGIDIELADAVGSRPFGVPRTGIFGLFDYVGLQLVPDVWGSTTAAVPDSDAYHRFDIATHPVIAALNEKGFTGRTGPSGFWRGTKEVLDPETIEYRPVNPEHASHAKRELAELLLAEDTAGAYARAVFAHTLVYCCEVADEIANRFADIDSAMELGYGWKKGPFALADAVGMEVVAQSVDKHFGDGDFAAPALLAQALEQGGFYTAGAVSEPTADARAIEELRADAASVLYENEDAVVVGTGTGAHAALLLKTKLGTITPGVVEALEEATRLAEAKEISSLVLANATAGSGAFSAGADLKVLGEIAAQGTAEEGFIARGLNALRALKYAPVPVVAAVPGLAVGGGLEIVLHCDAAVYHWDARLGFPERNVGIFAGWGGPVQQSLRLVAAQQASQQASEEAIATTVSFCAQATPTRGAYPAAELGLVREPDVIMACDSQVLVAALKLAEDLAEGYQPLQAEALPLHADLESLVAGASSPEFDEADLASIRAVATLLSGEGSATEEELYPRSAKLVAELVANPANAEKIRSALGRLTGRR